MAIALCKIRLYDSEGGAASAEARKKFLHLMLFFEQSGANIVIKLRRRAKKRATANRDPLANVESKPSKEVVINQEKKLLP